MLSLLAALAAAPAVAAGQRISLPVGLAELEARATRDSNDAAAHFNLALGYWNAKRWDDVERELRLAVAIEPQFAEGWLALGRLPYGRRLKLWDDVAERRVSAEWKPRLEEAYRYYRRAFLINPLVDLRIEAAARPPKSIYWTATEWLAQIYDYLFGGFDEIQTGNYAAAYNRFNQIIQDAPSRVERENLPTFIYYLRGLAAGHIERWDDAIQDFDRLLDLSMKEQSPDSLVYYIPIETNEYRYMLGVLHQRAGRLEEAASYYREAVEKDIGLYMAHVRLAGLAETNRDWTTAIAERRAAVNANPDDPSLLLDLGRTLGTAGDLAEAEDVLRQGQDANPRDSRLSYYLGVVQQQANKKEEARASFTRFIALAPSRYERQVASARSRLAALQ